ncbi:ryncolin-4-like isoform X2 [Physella acuta]|nr:ryncolin-4-like isoform X2 [Physella acuta]XP_059162806.1 ryncolin-4-like isoform X2 [Physella acuta]
MDFTRLLCAIVLLFFQPYLCARAENDKNISKPKLKSLDLLLDPTINMDSSTVRPTHFSCVTGSNSDVQQWTAEISGNKIVLCGVKRDSGEPIVILRRVKGGVNFSRGWVDYKIGFGSFDGDFWIGNDWISYLTHNGYSELRCNLKYKGISLYKVYRDFKVGNEADLYRLYFNNKTDNPLDLFTYNNGMPFSTFDRDHDRTENNCAASCAGGWWYKACSYVKLTGDWTKLNDCNGMQWTSTETNIVDLEYAEMQLHLVNLK